MILGAKKGYLGAGGGATLGHTGTIWGWGTKGSFLGWKGRDWGKIWGEKGPFGAPRGDFGVNNGYFGASNVNCRVNNGHLGSK